MDQRFSDWPTLSLQLLFFAAAYRAQKGIKGTRTPEEYVRLGARDVNSGVYGFDLAGKSLFEFVALAIAHRIDEDARGSAA